MNRQQIRQAARKKALEGQENRRRERAIQDKRLEGLAVDVLVAMAERDEAVYEAEQQAGIAVRSMQGEGLSASQVAQWCGEGMSVREVRRLAQGVTDDSQASESETGHTPSDAQSVRGQKQRAG